MDIGFIIRQIQNPTVYIYAHFFLSFLHFLCVEIIKLFYKLVFW